MPSDVRISQTQGPTQYKNGSDTGTDSEEERINENNYIKGGDDVERQFDLNDYDDTSTSLLQRQNKNGGKVCNKIS